MRHGGSMASLGAGAMRVLVIDDDPGRDQLIERITERTSFEVMNEPDGPALLSQVEELAPDLVILGELKGGTRALREVTTRIKAIRPNTYVLVADGKARDSAALLLEAGVSGFLSRDQPDWFLHRMFPSEWRSR